PCLADARAWKAAPGTRSRSIPRSTGRRGPTCSSTGYTSGCCGTSSGSPSAEPAGDCRGGPRATGLGPREVPMITTLIALAALAQTTTTVTTEQQKPPPPPPSTQVVVNPNDSPPPPRTNVRVDDTTTVEAAPS